MLDDKRIRVIIGHYGSGKTEFSVNYAIALAKLSKRKVALADLDVVNPYFRSRERFATMQAHGITVFSSQLGNNVNFDLPSLDAAIIGPLQNEAYDVVLDVGGDATGARILAQYRAYLKPGNFDVFAIVNANRPETADSNGIANHLKAIESEIKAKVSGIVNNTHLLWDTTVEDVLRGQRIIEQVATEMAIPIVYVAAKRDVAKQLPAQITGTIMPIDMHMRDSWM
ncbi:MAG: ATP-binding protein [Clostridiales bacterium]|nr:MAG: ATP-binding protein [Clostridiales bacterium]